MEGLAQYPPTPPIPRPPAQRPYAPPGEARLEHLTKALNLTEDQQTQIKQILETQSQANENWRKEHGQELRDLHQQVQKARQENDTEALKAATQKFRELFKDRREAEKNVRDQIAAVEEANLPSSICAPASTKNEV